PYVQEPDLVHDPVHRLDAELPAPERRRGAERAGKGAPPPRLHVGGPSRGPWGDGLGVAVEADGGTEARPHPPPAPQAAERGRPAGRRARRPRLDSTARGRRPRADPPPAPPGGRRTPVRLPPGWRNPTPAAGATTPGPWPRSAAPRRR